MLENRIEKIPVDIKNNKRVVKFNIPEDYASYLSGNGEGCFGYIEDEETYEKYDKDEGMYAVILMHNCWEYSALEKGTVCLVEARKGKRPVVIWDWLMDEVYSEYCEDIIDTLEEDDDVKISLEYNSKNRMFNVKVVYPNGNVFVDFITNEEVQDGLDEMNEDEEMEEEPSFDLSLLCAVGWRIDKFRNDGYKINWLDEEE